MGAIWGGGGGGALAPHPPDFLTYIHTTNEVNLVLCSEGVKGHNTSNIGEQYYSIAKLELMSCSLYLAPLLCNTCVAQSRYCRTLEITDSTTNTETLFCSSFGIGYPIFDAGLSIISTIERASSC